MDRQNQLEQARKAAHAAFARHRGLRGDIRSEEELIAAIEKDGRSWYPMERGTNEPVTYTKEDLIARIRRNTSDI